MKHLCHAPGCETPVPPRMFMCKSHWYKLPKAMRDRIWATYQPGQERLEVLPTDEYLEATREARQFIRKVERVDPT